MHRFAFALTTSSMAAVLAAGVVGFAAPAAQAEGLGGVSGWSPSTNVCGTGNLIPIVIGNTTDSLQTASITVAEGTAANVQVFTSLAAAQNAQGCGRAENMTAPGYSLNFSVAPQSTNVYYAMLGGVDYNAIGDSHNIAFGGLPSNTPSQGWYNLELSLTATESFNGLQANYEGTGGTNGSNQANFNLVACNTANNAVNLTDNILTPYSVGDTNGPSYGWGAPICAAWLPQGEMVDFSSYPTNGVAANAAQVNGATMSLAGSSTFALNATNVAIRYAGMSNITQNGYVSIGTNGINLIQASNGDFAITGVPLLGTSGEIQFITGGQTFAFYAF